MIEILAFAKAYWKQLAGVAAVAALALLGLHWLHERDAEHFAAGQAEVQRRWDQQSAADARLSAERDGAYRRHESDAAAAAQKAANDRLAAEKEISDLRTALADAGRLRSAAATAFQRRIADMPGAGACTASIDAAGRLGDLAVEGAGLLDEARVLLERADADIRQRDAVIAADRATARP